MDVLCKETNRYAPVNMSHLVKARIVEELRARGMAERADFVDRQFPEEIDTVKNASLLRMLKLDPDVVAAATISD
jgi:hypothetical protein